VPQHAAIVEYFMAHPVDDPRSGTGGAIPNGTDMGSAGHDHPAAHRAVSGGASGSSGPSEANSTGGASGSGSMGALPDQDDAARGRSSGASSGDERGAASGSGGPVDTPSGASGSSDADDDEDSGT
jgi:hypothetical protein